MTQVKMLASLYGNGYFLLFVIRNRKLTHFLRKDKDQIECLGT